MDVMENGMVSSLVNQETMLQGPVDISQELADELSTPLWTN
jgi:hypothetical protein